MFKTKKAADYFFKVVFNKVIVHCQKKINKNQTKHKFVFSIILIMKTLCNLMLKIWMFN